MNPLQLKLDGVSAVVDAVHGGRLASLNVGGRELLAGNLPGNPLHWGSYPMVPWVGRTRRGRFSFDGVDYELPINMEPHAIHGTGYAMVTCPIDRTLGFDDGVVAAHADTRTEGILVVDLDLELIAQSRANPEPPGLSNVRPDLYARHSTTIGGHR